MSLSLLIYSPPFPPWTLSLSPFLLLTPHPQLVCLQCGWRNPLTLRTCSGCWNVACSLPTWPSTPATRARSWAGRTLRSSVLSAPTSASCWSGGRPGSGPCRAAPVGSVTGASEGAAAAAAPTPCSPPGTGDWRTGACPALLMDTSPGASHAWWSRTRCCACACGRR